MTSLVDDAIELLERGFSVIPVGRDKKPAIPSWKEYQTRLATHDEVLSWWKKDPSNNIAIPTGALSKIVVVDVDTQEGLNNLKKHFPPSPVHVKTGRGWHRYYRHPGGVVENAVNFFPGLDIRGDGGYVIAPPSVHPSGAVYTWCISEGGWDSLPTFTLPKKGNLIDINFAKVTAMTTADYSGLTAGSGRNNRLAQLVGAWAAMGYPFEILEMTAQGWNLRNQPPLPQREVFRTVESIYKKHIENHPEALEKHNVVIPVDGEIPPDVEIIDVSKEDDVLSIPEELLHPGGFLESFMDYIDESTATSSRVYNLGAGIAFLGTLLGQKFMTPTGLRTNFYCIGIGSSGTGKDSPQKAIAEIMRRTRAGSLMGANMFTSDTAICQCLMGSGPMDEHVKIFILDEVGLLLSSFKNPNGYKTEVATLLMTLITSGDKPYTKVYGNTKNNLTLPYHLLCIYGATTPERFWENMTRTEAIDGFLSRFLFFHCDESLKRPKLKLNKKLPQDIIDFVNDTMKILINQEEGNLSNTPAPRETYFLDETQRVIEEWTDKMHNMAIESAKSDPIVSSIYQRVAENMYKVALCHAFSNYKDDKEVFMEIPLESVQYAIKFMEWHTKRIIADIRNNVVDSEFQKKVQRVINAIKFYVRNHKGKPGASESFIHSFCKGMSVKEIREVIDKLKQSKSVIFQRWKPKRGREVDLYILTKEKEV